VARKNNNARRKFDTRMTFDEIGKALGLNPRQRIIMRRILLNKKKFLKGGENDVQA
jgi:hypothetical protein